MSEEIKQKLQQLKDLILPFEKWNSSSEPPVLWLNKMIEDKVKLTSEKKEIFPECNPSFKDEILCHDSKWVYVIHCLRILGSLKEMLIYAGLPIMNSELNAETKLVPLTTFQLSSSDTEIIAKVVQGIIVLGVIPNLFLGVGLPSQKRKKIFQIFQEATAADEVEIDDKMSLKRTKHEKISFVLTELLSLLNVDAFSSAILTKHLGDLLAGLIQAAFSPVLIDDFASEAQNGVETSETLDNTRNNNQNSQQEKIKKELYQIIDRIFPPLAIRYLLVLQSTVSMQTSAAKQSSGNSNISVETFTPKWFQNACGMLLTYLINRPEGVLYLIKGVLNIGQEKTENEKESQKKYTIIATVASNPVLNNSKYQDLENYFSSICPQILEILVKSQDPLSDETSESRKQYATIACICIRHLSERSSILSNRYLFDQLMEPFMRLTHDCLLVKEGGKNIIVEEDEFYSSVNQLYLIFVSCNEPSIMFLGILRPIILPLLYVHCKICFGESHLRRKVEKLVVHFLKYSSPTLSMKVLRVFAFNERTTANPGKKDADKLMSVNQDVIIAENQNGGLIALKENYTDDTDDDEENVVKYKSPSFYVADDEKSIAIIDTLEYLKSKDLTFQFYLNLLQDLTDMLDDIEPKSDNKIDSDYHEISNIKNDIDMKHSTEEQTIQSLLAMENELEDSMRKVRKRMMVIRMIGLMSEDEGLRESLLQNSGKMIEFLQATIRRAAKLCEKRNAGKKLEQTKSDEDNEANEKDSLKQEVTTDEVQSLTTALGLLRNLVVGGGDPSFRYTNVKLKDWDTLQLGLEDLEVIEMYHEEKSIGLMAGKLKELITTNIAVMAHNTKMRNDADTIRKKTEELNNKIKEFKYLLSQSKGETSDDNNTQTSKKDAEELSSNNGVSDVGISTHPPVIMNEVLSLKSLAASVIENQNIGK